MCATAVTLRILFFIFIILKNHIEIILKMLRNAIKSQVTHLIHAITMSVRSVYVLLERFRSRGPPGTKHVFKMAS